MDKYCNIQDNTRYKKTIKTSILLSLLGLFISRFLPINVSIVPWIANIIALFLLMVCFGRYHKRDILVIGLISVLFQVVSAFVFSNHFLDNINAIGTNANFVSWLFYVLILSAIATGYFHLSDEDIIEIMRVILNYSCISAGIVLAMDYRKISAILSGSFNSYASAMKGFFPNKNMFGMTCAFGIIAGVYYIFTRKQVKKTVYKCAFLVLMLVLSFCRTAWFFTFVFLGAFFLQNFYIKSQKDKKTNRRLFWGLFIAACICLVFILSNAKLKDIIEINFLRLDIGDAGRKSIQQILLSEYKNRGIIAALFGIGYSEYSYLCSIDVHNVYIYTLVTGGIAKTVALLVLIIFSIKMNKRCYNEILRHCGISTLFAFLAISFFETFEPFEVGFSNMLFFIYILLLPMLQSRKNCSAPG